MSSVTQHIHGKPSAKRCAGFDMDDTLITGSKIAYFSLPGAVDKIAELHEQGYNILIFSNQKRPQMNDSLVKAKIEATCHIYSPEGNIPLHFFCARDDDQYRKPNIGMLKLIPEEYGPLELYIGDANGSEGSHSDSDLQFAIKAGVKFFTPETFFNRYPIILRSEVPQPLLRRKIHFLTMIILIGYPASGKTTYATEVLSEHKYVRISRDELKTMTACIKECSILFTSDPPQSVVIDNLNASRSDREKFIKVAKQFGVAIYAIHFNIPMAKAMSQNSKREKIVSQVVLYKFRKSFELPEYDEGIIEIFAILD